MTEWAYKFTKSKKSRQDTTRLALELRFLARSAYRRMVSGAPGGAINNVKKVEPGDVVHAYYVDKKGAHSVGSFRVVDPDSRGEHFERVWPEKSAALARVNETEANRALLDALRKPSTVGTGYLPDPRLNMYTGWLVELIRSRTPPRYESITFTGQNTLVRIDVEPLAREQSDDELLSRVVHDPDVMGGKPCIRGTRVTVGTILGLLASGHSFESILADFPYLQELDLRAALAYAAWRTQGRDLPLEAA